MPATGRTDLPVVVAVDPGSAKCGVAVVDSGGKTVFREVVPTRRLPDKIIDLCGTYAPIGVVLGDGTGSRAVRATLAGTSGMPDIHVVEEAGTSREARERWADQAAAVWWQRLVPRGLRAPKDAYDDLVASILGEKWWRNENKAEGTGSLYS